MAISNPSGNYIDKITLPTGTIYTIVDAAAREAIDNMSSYTAFLGVVSTSTPIEDGSTTAVVSIGGTSVTAVTGNIAIYKASATATAQEFIFDGSKWQFFGDISAQNLGKLAYKDSASANYVKFSSVNTGSATVTSTGTYTPAGEIELTKSSVTLAISSTTTNPGAGNTANYWIYQPEGTVSVTYTTVSTSADVIKTVTAKEVVTSVTTTAPTSAAVTNGINYTNVDDHNLLLNYLVTPRDTAATTSTTKAYVSTKTAKTTTCSFSGTTHYVKPLSVTVTTAAELSGTAATITVNSSAKFINSVTSTTASTTLTVQ